jgi:DNA excision repair protein ERCC-2
LPIKSICGIRVARLDREVAEYFPYTSVRPHQDEFIKTVHEAVEQSKSALIEGSNGLGKTVAVLSACLPQAVNRKLKILYVARTHRQHDRVIEELSAISKKQQVSGISIRGRHEMCLHGLIAGHPLDTRAAMEICELLKAKDRCQYYRSIEEQAEEYSDTQQQVVLNPCTASEIRKICRKRGFCPYELAKSVLSDVNVIALSYLYVFDPVIRNAFLRNLETTLSKIILVIDEAHNLPETAVDIASSRLSLFAIKQAETEAKNFKHEEIANFAKTFRKEIEEMTKEFPKQKIVTPEFMVELVREKTEISEPKEFFEHLHDTGVLIKRELLAQGRFPRSFIHSLGYFMLKWLETAEDQSYINVISKYTSKQGAPTARLEIAALDPSKITAPVFSQVCSSIAVSGTLQPLDAYVRITKLPKDTISNVVPSPFPKEHVLPLICCGVTTAMERRTPEMYAKIIEKIEEVAQSTPANTGIFAPSFDVLGALLAEGLKEAVEKPLFCEHRSMSSRENEKLVAEFKARSKQGGAVLLGVQGGRSSEGVDFPGDEMNSVAIVGVPYAEPTPKVKAQIQYFEECFPRYGREYGYVLPAMKKASQAAGRPIRTLDDKGAMIFLDHRFASEYCRSFLPSWIRESVKILPDEKGCVSEELQAFFRQAC